MFNLSISIIVPALNEGPNLQVAVEEIVKTFDGNVKQYEILIYNDKSIDDTGTIADDLANTYSNIRVFHNPKRLNIGGIYKQGIKEAKHDYIVLIPGDNEAIPGQIIRALNYLDKVDLVVFFHRNESIRRFKRRIISSAYTIFINLIFGTDFSYTNDTNVYKKTVLNSFKINANDFSYQTECLIKAIKLGVDFIEIGNNIRNREYGTTKLNFFKSAWSVFRNIFKLWAEVMILKRRIYSKKGKKLPKL